MRLPYRQITEYRTQTLLLQNNLCGLCGEPIDLDAVLDHDHKTGLVRQVLHRGCNALLGKIENNLRRNRITNDRLAHIAANLMDYIQTTHTDLVHPTHKESKMKNAYKKKGGGRKPPKKY